MADGKQIPTQEGWLYLGVVLDVWSRGVVGWSMRSDARAALWWWTPCRWHCGAGTRAGAGRRPPRQIQPHKSNLEDRSGPANIPHGVRKML